MANEISGRMMANMPGPAKETGQFANLDVAKVPEADGQALPVEGKVLPQQASGNSASNSELREAVSQINNFVQKVQRDLSFSMDEGSGRTIIKVIESNSGKLVRQIPSEEVLALATYLQDVNKDTSGSGEIPQGILFSDTT